MVLATSVLLNSTYLERLILQTQTPVCHLLPKKNNIWSRDQVVVMEETLSIRPKTISNRWNTRIWWTTLKAYLVNMLLTKIEHLKTMTHPQNHLVTICTEIKHKKTSKKISTLLMRLRWQIPRNMRSLQRPIAHQHRIWYLEEVKIWQVLTRVNHQPTKRMITRPVTPTTPFKIRTQVWRHSMELVKWTQVAALPSVASQTAIVCHWIPLSHSLQVPWWELAWLLHTLHPTHSILLLPTWLNLASPSNRHPTRELLTTLSRIPMISRTSGAQNFTTQTASHWTADCQSAHHLSQVAMAVPMNQPFQLGILKATRQDRPSQRSTSMSRLPRLNNLVLIIPNWVVNLVSHLKIPVGVAPSLSSQATMTEGRIFEPNWLDTRKSVKTLKWSDRTSERRIQSWVAQEPQEVAQMAAFTQRTRPMLARTSKVAIVLEELRTMGLTFLRLNTQLTRCRLSKLMLSLEAALPLESLSRAIVESIDCVKRLSR